MNELQKASAQRADALKIHLENIKMSKFRVALTCDRRYDTFEEK